MFEIAGAQIIKNAPDKFYHICDYVLDGKFLKIRQLGDIVTNFLPKIDGNYRNFRNVNWNESLDYLDNIVNDAFNANKNVMFGTNSSEQFNFLINYYAGKCKTLAVTYTEDSYSQLLEHLVDHHIHLLKNSSLEITPLDQYNLENLTDAELKEYYKTSFEGQELLPKSFYIDADHTLDFLDLIDPCKFDAWLGNLGFSFTKESKQFYQNWLMLNQVQQKLFNT
jgi:hypothetical protein